MQIAMQLAVVSALLAAGDTHSILYVLLVLAVIWVLLGMTGGTRWGWTPVVSWGPVGAIIVILLILWLVNRL